MDEGVLYELLKEVREENKKHTQELSKQGTCLDNLREDFSEMKQDVKKNTEDVEQHIRRTELLEQRHEEERNKQKENTEKIEELRQKVRKLEEPRKARKWLKEHFLSVTSVIIAALSIVALITRILGAW